MPEKQQQASAYDPRPKLRRIMAALRLPAGDDPRFGAPAAIAGNWDEFVPAVHATWKDIQAEVIREIVTIETMLARPETAKMPREWWTGLGIYAVSGDV